MGLSISSSPQLASGILQSSYPGSSSSQDPDYVSIYQQNYYSALQSYSSPQNAQISLFGVLSPNCYKPVYETLINAVEG